MIPTLTPIPRAVQHHKHRMARRGLVACVIVAIILLILTVAARADLAAAAQYNPVTDPDAQPTAWCPGWIFLISAILFVAFVTWQIVISIPVILNHKNHEHETFQWSNTRRS